MNGDRLGELIGKVSDGRGPMETIKEKRTCREDVSGKKNNEWVAWEESRETE